MDNLYIYNTVKSVPDNAKKNIHAGRLKGMTDINPMWRIKMLTEQFGPCGIGWYTEIEDHWTQNGADGVVTAHMNIRLYIKVDGEWSKPIAGTGGSTLVAKESKGLYTSDECFKMAYTDALSVCCKALGFGADVYWDKDKTKYDPPSEAKRPVCPVCNQPVKQINKQGKSMSPDQVLKNLGMCYSCHKKQKEQQNSMEDAAFRAQFNQ